MNSKTLEANSIPIPPHLAGLLKRTLGRTGTGFDEGAFLQQLHYWTLNSATTGWIVDGVKWIYNSLKSWQQQFPWMSEYGLRKAIANLKKLGLIQTAQHWVTQYKRVMFYRIDYERLQAFAGALCDLITPRSVNRDHVDRLDERISDSETSSNTSDSEQQTVVVSKGAEDFTDTHDLQILARDQAAGIEVSHLAPDNFSPASSGNPSKVGQPQFPELMNAVAQAIAHPSGSPLPPTLRRAIAQFPDRVKGAISYLQYQQQRQPIQNSIGYLYQAIVQGWNFSLPSSNASPLPPGFQEWFNWAKAQGFAIAATTLGGVHHTLHVQQGWIPTEQLMHTLPCSALYE